MTRSDLLDADQLSQVLATTHRDLFRMETLPAYDVPINGNDLQRWSAGEPEPTWANKQPWLDTLARWKREGRPRRRVRVIHDPPTDYERYACDWGYRLNEEAGENIRVLDLAATGLPIHGRPRVRRAARPLALPGGGCHLEARHALRFVVGCAPAAPPPSSCCHPRTIKEPSG